MKENTEVSRLAATDIINNFILAVICSFASKLVSQENDTVAKAAEEVLRFYRDANRNIEGRSNEKEHTANYTHASLFDKHVLIDPSLSPIDKAVYSVLRVLADNNKLECSPKVEIIAAHASCSQRSVYRSLDTLEALGTIKRTPRFRNHKQISSIYKIIICNPASDTDIKHSGDIATETKHPADNTDYHLSAAADEACPANEPTGCQGITMTDCQSVVSVPECQNDTMTDWQSEKTLFKYSLKGGSLSPRNSGKKLRGKKRNNSGRNDTLGKDKKLPYGGRARDCTQNCVLIEQTACKC